MLQKKAWCFLSRFQTQTRVDADFQSFLSFREYAIRRNFAAAFTSEQGHRIAFWGIAFFVAYALKAFASLDLNYYVACMYSCSLTLAVKLGSCNMQFILAVLPPNCSRCDISMTKIQKFSGGACPQTLLLGRPSRATTLASVSLHSRVVHPASRPPHFKRAGAGPGRRKAWFRCHLTVHV